jgi:hydrogenase-4 component B
MTPELSVIIAIVICLAGALATLLASANKTLAGWINLLFTLAAAALIITTSTHVLISGPGEQHAFPVIPQIGLILRVYVDGLTAIFLMLAAIISVPAALYSIVYMRSYQGYSVARYYPYFLLFLAAMYGLVSTTDMMWFFLIFWQLMTLPGYALIRYENKKPENIRAANKYLIMMQIACAATMVGAEILAIAGSAATGGGGLKYDFDTVSSRLPHMLSTMPVETSVAFGLFLIGFGIKMGMWPFGQFWLPDAHPAAPSPVSAMLSGVMIKTGVYGLMRYFLYLVPPDAHPHFPLANWGLIIAVLGTITLFTGTMQALKQEQSKRLLAFHSIGQVGYILLGTGACMCLLMAPSGKMQMFAAVAFLGALLHVLNHGLFKALLFLNAGSLLHATGTQDLNKMGGLMKYMPLTAVTALVASFSISGVPLFNGFVSKWTIYSATIQGSEAMKLLPIMAVIAILTSAITLASFIKFFGVSFLSRASTLVNSKAEAAKFNLDHPRLEVGWSMQLPQLLLAAACLLLGLLPALGIGLMQRAVEKSPQGYGENLADFAPMQTGILTGVQQSQDFLSGLSFSAVYAPLVLALVLGLCFLLVRALSKMGGATRRSAEPWLCGYAREADCHRYSAHNFYLEIKRYFHWLGGASHEPREKTLPKP